jgi:hydroxymethylpyrimidine pyrophosphatase-like HAD family hydrolase
MNNIEKIVSFDFDDTLISYQESSYFSEIPILNEKVYSLMKQYKADGYKVIIVTTRYEHLWGSETLEILTKFNILGPIIESKDDVHFTNHQWKVDTLKKLNVSIHYDDNPYEIQMLNGTEIVGILVHEI